MSFSITKAQFLDGTKTVTRRLGWKNLKAGDRVLGVEKCMGLRKGERHVVLGEVEIVDVRREPLDAINGEPDGDAAEGFPGMGTAAFVDMFCKAMRCRPSDEVTRIEFRRVPATGEGESDAE